MATAAEMVVIRRKELLNATGALDIAPETVRCLGACVRVLGVLPQPLWREGRREGVSVAKYVYSFDM